ncbi:pyruvate kinase [Deinococcus sp. UYEF24]
MTTPPRSRHPLQFQQLTAQLQLLRQEVLDYEQTRRADIERAAPECRASTRNLIHYLAVRQHDLRELQRGLARLGLSSLGRMEANVLPTLNAVLLAVRRLSGEPVPETTVPEKTAPGERSSGTDMDQGDRLLRAHALHLLGPSPQHRDVRIMVTMPSEAADDPSVILNALEQGMDIMRVNCAHDDAAAWTRMVAHLRAACAQLGRPCRTEFDLAGPKLRTGPVTPGPEVLKWKPERDRLGRVTAPARLFLTQTASAAPTGAMSLPLRPGLPLHARIGDELRLTDSRGRRRRLKLIEVSPDGWLSTCERTGYVTSGLRLTLHRDGKSLGRLHLGTLPARAQALLLHAGDHLLLTSAPTPGEAATVSQPAHISCTLPQVLGAARPGHRILFDDGRITGVIRGVTSEGLEIEMTQVPGGGLKQGGARLRAEKGINLPDTELDLPVMGAKDLNDLEQVAPHADLISLSFVRRRRDVEALMAELGRIGATRAGIVLKIENRQAFENLPELLLAALQYAPVAVMVARGDLAVEIGFERLAEVQEEILWLCEAAHVPVIWATQVLDTLARTGLPTRAEVTDAAMAGRAEGVMLNKGPYINEAIHFLDDVLGRMRDHQDKKTAMLRKLEVSGRSGG